MRQNIIHVDKCECYLDGDKGIVVAPCGPEKNAVQVYQELTAEVLELKTKNARQTESLKILLTSNARLQAENERLQGIQAGMSDKLTELFGELKG